jgi:hypothetical protein
LLDDTFVPLGDEGIFVEKVPDTMQFKDGTVTPQPPLTKPGKTVGKIRQTINSFTIQQ